MLSFGYLDIISLKHQFIWQPRTDLYLMHLSEIKKFTQQYFSVNFKTHPPHYLLIVNHENGTDFTIVFGGK